MNLSNIEKFHVKDVYECIAYSFDISRIKLWDPVKNFINSLNPNSLVLDAGCGNGKNMLIRNDINIIGFDSCVNLINICHKKQLNVFVCDIKNIQLKSNTYDSIICIAVIGHIFKENDRIKAINELIRVVNKDGIVFIQCWGINALKIDKTKNKYTKINDNNDYFVSFGNDKGIKRYYHLFTNEDLTSLLKKCNCEIINIFFDSTGIYGLIKKI